MLWALSLGVPAPLRLETAYSSSKYAAIALAGKLPDGLSRVTGVASRSPSPLFGQDKPWEPRLDNGYPNIVAPASEGGAWQLWYGDCVKGCSTQLLLYANSTDGVAWHKPADALLPKCAFGNASTPVTPSLHNCSAMYGDAVALDDGSRIVLTGRERPALLFDEATGAPTHLFNGAIDANQSVPWYAMAQAIKIKQEAHKI